MTSILYIGAAGAASVFGIKRPPAGTPGAWDQVQRTTNVMKTNNRSQKPEVRSQKLEAGLRNPWLASGRAYSVFLLCVLCASAVNFAATAQVTTNRIQFRRGLDVDRATNVFAAGEPAWSTNTHKLWLGDGATHGGLGVTMDADLAATMSGFTNFATASFGGSNWTVTIVNNLSNTFTNSIVSQTNTLRVWATSSFDLFGAAAAQMYNLSNSVVGWLTGYGLLGGANVWTGTNVFSQPIFPAGIVLTNFRWQSLGSVWSGFNNNTVYSSPGSPVPNPGELIYCSGNPADTYTVSSVWTDGDDPMVTINGTWTRGIGAEVMYVYRPGSIAFGSGVQTMPYQQNYYDLTNLPAFDPLGAAAAVSQGLSNNTVNAGSLFAPGSHQSALSFTVTNVYKSTNYVYITPNGVTNMVDSGSTNYTALTGVSTFDTTTTTLLGENTAYGAELVNGMLVYDGQPGTCVGQVASIQDDATATLCGNAPYDASGYITLYRAATIFSTIVYDLTNIVSGLQTNLSFYAFNDGSRQTTAFSNSAAQINGMFGGPLALQSYADAATVTQQQNLSNLIFGVIQSSGWLTADSNVAFRGVDNQFAVNQSALSFTVTNLYKPTNYVYVIPNGATNIVFVGTNYCQLSGTSSFLASYITVGGSGSAYQSELTPGNAIYAASDGSSFIGSVMSVPSDILIYLQSVTTIGDGSYVTIWRADAMFSTNVYDLTNIVAGVQTNISFYAFDDGSRQSTAFSNSAAQINSIFGGPLALQADVDIAINSATHTFTGSNTFNGASIFNVIPVAGGYLATNTYTPTNYTVVIPGAGMTVVDSGTVATNIAGPVLDTQSQNIGQDLSDDTANLVPATVLTNIFSGAKNWPVALSSTNIVLQDPEDTSIQEFYTVVTNDAHSLTLGKPIQSLGPGLNLPNIYYVQLAEIYATNACDLTNIVSGLQTNTPVIWLQGLGGITISNGNVIVLPPAY